MRLEGLIQIAGRWFGLKERSKANEGCVSAARNMSIDCDTESNAIRACGERDPFHSTVFQSFKSLESLGRHQRVRLQISLAWYCLTDNFGERKLIELLEKEVRRF